MYRRLADKGSKRREAAKAAVESVGGRMVFESLAHLQEIRIQIYNGALVVHVVSRRDLFGVCECERGLKPAATSAAKRP